MRFCRKDEGEGVNIEKPISCNFSKRQREKTIVVEKRQQEKREDL